jgi:hypothetical protein
MARQSKIGANNGSTVSGMIAERMAVVQLGLLAVGALVLGAPASAQQPATENPDALRPPTFLAYPVASRQQEVVRLYFAELRRALQTGDTTTLSALVPDSVIPAGEKRSARPTGCASLGAAMTGLRVRASVIGGLRSIALDQVAVSPAGQGDTVAFGAARLRAGGRTSGLSVALTRSGHARSMARVEGLLLALCTAPG